MANKKNNQKETENEKIDVPDEAINNDASDKESSDEGLDFVHANKRRLERSLAAVNKRDVLSRFVSFILSCFYKLVRIIDYVKQRLVVLLMKLPSPEIIKQSLYTLGVVTNLRGIVDFFRTKLYAFKKSPRNSKLVQKFDGFVASASQQGEDIKQQFPDLVDKLVVRKNQMLQHSFFKEFNKSSLERLLAIPFSFSRSLSPVLPDRAMWHKLFGVLESRYIQDVILVDDDGKQTSLKDDSKRQVESSHSVRYLYEASVYKAHGHRVFIIGHHEGYLGPYFVRSALRRLGFDNLAENCNTVVGPRMFSNLLLNSGARNVGNLFLTLPSQRTTKVNEDGLAEALQICARRTQCLIKMPNVGLKVIDQFTYHDFMELIEHYDDIGAELDQLTSSLSWLGAVLSPEEITELVEYLRSCDAATVMSSFDKKDYYLFKKVMHEPFLIFPEGSRSYVNDNGDITLKYFNPKFLQAYLRPGDVILPLSVVGGSEILQGAKLKKGKLGMALGSPYTVTEEMIDNFAVEGVEIMKNIANLTNLKKVHFSESVQAGEKFEP